MEEAPTLNSKTLHGSISSTSDSHPKKIDHSAEKTHSFLLNSRVFQHLTITLAAAVVTAPIAFACSLALPEIIISSAIVILLANTALFIVKNCICSKAPKKEINTEKEKGQIDNSDPDKPLQSSKEKEIEKNTETEEELRRKTEERRKALSLIIENETKQKLKTEQEQSVFSSSMIQPKTSSEKEKEKEATTCTPSMEKEKEFLSKSIIYDKKTMITQRFVEEQLSIAPLPPYILKYAEWFKELASTHAKAREEGHCDINHQALVTKCSRYGEMLMMWAKEWNINLSPTDPVYQDLTEQFLTFFCAHALPIDEEELGKVFLKNPEAFHEDHLRIMDYFFISYEHKMMVKMLMLRNRRPDLSIENLERQICGNIMELSGPNSGISSKKAQLDTLRKKTVGANEEEVKSLMCDIVRLYNMKELEKLKPVILQHVDEKTADLIISEGHFLRTEIRLGLALIDEPSKAYFLQKVEQYKETLAKASEDLEKLERQLTKDLPPAESLIYIQFPALKLVESLPGSQAKQIKNKYKMTVNRAFLMAEIKRKTGFYKEKRLEDAVLRELFPDSDKKLENYTQEAVDALGNIMQGLLGQEEFEQTSLKQLKNFLEQLAFATRIKPLGLTVKESENVKIIIDAVKQFKSTMKKGNPDASTLRLMPEKEKEEWQKKMPKVVAKLQNVKKRIYKKTISATCSSFLKNDKEFILQNLNLPHQEFVDLINKRMETNLKHYSEQIEQLDQSSESALDDMIAFYKHFLDGGVKVIPYSQGEEGFSTILGKGICRAKEYEVNLELLKDPKIDIASLKVDTTKAYQRFLQAFMGVRHRKKEDGLDKLIPPSVLELDNVKEKLVHRCDSVEKVIEFLQTQYDSLQNNNPALSIVMEIKATDKTEGAAHIINLRFDKKKNRYIIYDPNHLIAESDKGTDWLEGAFRLLMASDWKEANDFRIYHLTNDNKARSSTLNPRRNRRHHNKVGTL